jgi:hypothetical protein
MARVFTNGIALMVLLGFAATPPARAQPAPQSPRGRAAARGWRRRLGTCRETAEPDRRSVWGLGPAFVLVRTVHPWVYGALVNTVFSLGGMTGAGGTKYALTTRAARNGPCLLASKEVG